MRYWNVQRIVREYVCPVRMVTQILGEMSAPDIFKARNTDIRELKEVCEIIAKYVQLGRKFPRKESNDLFLERPPPCESAKISFFAFSAWPNKSLVVD